MKKLIFMFAMILGLSFVSCNRCSEKCCECEEVTDTIAVDSVLADTIVVDSIL